MASAEVAFSMEFFYLMYRLLIMPEIARVQRLTNNAPQPGTG